MPPLKHVTVAFDEDTCELMERFVPASQRTAFVNEAVRGALRRMERGKLQQEMAACAAEMHEVITEIQAEMTPLEEELHRVV